MNTKRKENKQTNNKTLNNKQISIHWKCKQFQKLKKAALSHWNDKVRKLCVGFSQGRHVLPSLFQKLHTSLSNPIITTLTFIMGKPCWSENIDFIPPESRHVWEQVHLTKETFFVSQDSIWPPCDKSPFTYPRIIVNVPCCCYKSICCAVLTCHQTIGSKSIHSVTAVSMLPGLRAEHIRRAW